MDPKGLRARRRVYAGLVFFAVYLVLGSFVSTSPPGPFDRSELDTLGVLVPLAAFLRLCGEFPVYATLCVLFLIVGFARRRLLPAALIAVLELVIVWKVSDAFKQLFHRQRPPLWFGVHESSPSYASGHATLSLAFYGFIAWLAWTSALPLVERRAIVTACALWILALGWSRLALGAHYPTDVLGGYALGAAALCFAAAVYRPPAIRTQKADIRLLS